MIWLFVLLILVCLFVCWQRHLVIRFDTFFKKGFRKITDKYGCYAWIGKQGSGKTLNLISFINDIRRPEQKVITNVKSYYENNKDFCIYNANFYDIIKKFENGTYTTDYIVFYDELFTLLEKGKLSKDILTFISQMRKRGVYLLTTVQEWLDINVTFRRYCRFYIDCQMFNIGPWAFSITTVHDGYDMHWNNLENEYESPILQTNFRKCVKAIADSYDTFEVIHDCARDSASVVQRNVAPRRLTAS